MSACFAHTVCRFTSFPALIFYGALRHTELLAPRPRFIWPRSDSRLPCPQLSNKLALALCQYVSCSTRASPKRITDSVSVQTIWNKADRTVRAPVSSACCTCPSALRRPPAQTPRACELGLNTLWLSFRSKASWDDLLASPSQVVISVPPTCRVFSRLIHAFNTMPARSL